MGGGLFLRVHSWRISVRSRRPIFPRWNSASAASTPWAKPGTYTVKLTEDGKSYTQPITDRPDPRVKTPAPVMQQIYSRTRAL